ncbi:MAG: hypothetical protein RMM31_06450 [Anaerolineae bacterium]|nr:hypothetical protein [Anaerolineae bacterium]
MRQYWVGHPGTGKSTRLIQRFVELVERGVRPDRILVLVPQASAGVRFRAALAEARGSVRGHPFIGTVYALARQHVELFFPRLASTAGFAPPYREPTFINVEGAQYVLNLIAGLRLAEFDDLKIHRARILSQILDGLNKAAVCGFPLTEIADRLNAAWEGREPRLPTYQRVQALALAFREFCLRHYLLDFSLTMTLFAERLLADDFYRSYLTARFRHVLADNIEENPPILHRFLDVLLPVCDSAVLVEDDPGGYRIFLGADVTSARRLRALCEVVEVPDPRLQFGAPLSPAQFGAALMRAAAQPYALPVPSNGQDVCASVRVLESKKFWGEMVRAVAQTIGELVVGGIPANEIAVLAPYVEDVLRFELQEQLRPFRVGVQPLRPSRPLWDHPVARAFVALAQLARPAWRRPVSPSDMARALSVCVADLDLIRAHHIARAIHRLEIQDLPDLTHRADLWAQVGHRFIEPYQRLRDWIELQRRTTSTPLDLLWQRLFTEVLSRPGFALSTDRDAAFVCDKLIRGARAFREALTTALAEHVSQTSPGQTEQPSLDLAYVDLLQQEGFAAQYVPERVALLPDADVEARRWPAVLLAPAYAYLTNDLRSRIQFWLDINTTGWHERPYQPLTHPYVLSASWAPGQRWTDADELRVSRETLARVVGGLAYRCRERIYLASSQLTVSGQDESGQLLRALQRVIRLEAQAANSLASTL